MLRAFSRNDDGLTSPDMGLAVLVGVGLVIGSVLLYASTKSEHDEFRVYEIVNEYVAGESTAEQANDAMAETEASSCSAIALHQITTETPPSTASFARHRRACEDERTAEGRHIILGLGILCVSAFLGFLGYSFKVARWNKRAH